MTRITAVSSGILLSALLLAACGGGRPALPGKRALRDYVGRDISEFEGRYGAPETTTTDGRGGKVYIWSAIRYDYDADQGVSAISSHPSLGSRTDVPSSGRKGEGESSVTTEVQVMVDSSGRIYDTKREVTRSR